MSKETKKEKKARLLAERRAKLQAVTGPAKPFQAVVTGKPSSLGGGIVVSIPRKKYSGHKARLKPWDLCQMAGCSTPTDSGKKEKELPLRYCRRHLPENVAVFQNEVKQGQARHAKCFSDLRAKTCTMPRFGKRTNPCPHSNERCLLPVAVDGQYDNGRCFLTRLPERNGGYTTLRWDNYRFYQLSGRVPPWPGKCLYLPYIQWNKKRTGPPFVPGVTKAPYPW
jgi:hypothetical protein